MIVRREQMRASKIMQDRVLKADNIQVYWNTVTEEVLGDTKVDGVRMRNVITNELQDVPVSAFFVAIGHHPNTDIFKGWIDMDEEGYLKTIPGTTKTNVEGVFAAGDVQDKIYRQAITAAGTGCMAALDAERYLSVKCLI
jgi:thioredoxin reductase (NADPH)